MHKTAELTCYLCGSVFFSIELSLDFHCTYIVCFRDYDYLFLNSLTNIMIFVNACMCCLKIESIVIKIKLFKYKSTRYCLYFLF